MAVSKYCGYKPLPMRELQPWGPSHSGYAQRDAIFSRKEAEHVADGFESTATIQMLASAPLKRELATAAALGKTGELSPKKKEQSLAILPMEKRLSGTTVCKGDFVDFHAEYKILRSKPLEDYSRAFQEVDKHGEGYVLLSELRMVLRAALQEEPTEHQLRIFEGILGGTKDRHVLQHELLESVEKVAAYIEKELLSTNPEYVRSSVAIAPRYKEQLDVQRRLGLTNTAALASSIAAGLTHADIARHGGVDSEGNPVGTFHLAGFEAQTCYMLDIGMNPRAAGKSSVGEGSAGGAGAGGETAGLSAGLTADKSGMAAAAAMSVSRRDLGPQSRPVSDPVGSGIFQTTRDLAGGTSRLSKHPPGYAGHIPTAISGPAAEQGLGAHERNAFHSKTNLSQTFLTRLPGYMGHTPVHGSSPAVEVRMPSGPRAATEYQRSAHTISQFWETKKRLGK